MGFESLVILYTDKHSHSPKETNLVRLEDIADENSDIETQGESSPVYSTPIRSSHIEKVLTEEEGGNAAAEDIADENFDIETHADNSPVSSTPIRSSYIEKLLPEDEEGNAAVVEDLESATTIEEKLRSSFADPKFFCFKFSSIKLTTISKINSDEMNDTFHIIEKNTGVRAFDACKDGFEYKRGKTRKVFPKLFQNQQVHKYECHGRLKCVNNECPIFKRLSALSYTTNKNNVSENCAHCSSHLVEDKCSGTKFIIHSSASPFAVVYYSVSHSCGNQDWVLDPNIIQQLTSLFETNDSATSAIAYKKLFEDKLRNALNATNKEAQNAHMKDLISLVNSCAQDHVVKNVKSKVLKAKTPLGMGIEAVKMLNDSSSLIHDKLGVIIRVVIESFVCACCTNISFSTEEEEEILTECCSKPMVNTGPVILVTSTDSLKSAVELSKDGGLFSGSTVHVDHQPGRCKTMNTLNVAFYDYNLREMASVFMTHSMGENQFNVLFEFKLFQCVLKEYCGSDAKFDPFGFTSDNAGGITSGIKLCFGPLKPHRTCRFHIIYCGYQHCGTSIGSKQDQILFLRYLFSLIDASTATLFVQIAEDFWKWIREQPARTKQLENWWDFWFNCRAMWSSAFTNQTLTEVSLVESLQSKYSKKNNLKKLPLYQSVVFAMSDITKYSARLSALGKGKYIGQGPSKTTLDERDMIKQLEKVKNVPLTDGDFKDIFTKLGLPYTSRTVETTSEDHLPESLVSPIAREKSVRHQVLENFTPSPIAKHTFKRPPAPKSSDAVTKAKKPGRPPKSKSKTYVSRFSRGLDFDVGEESEEDLTVEMLSDFVAASSSVPDEILFNDGTSEQNKSDKVPRRSSKRPKKSKLSLSSIFGEEESVSETQLMDDNHVAAGETFEGEIVFNVDGKIGDKPQNSLSEELEENDTEDVMRSIDENIDSEEDWLEGIDWNETIFSQGTLDQLDKDMNEQSPSSVSTRLQNTVRKKSRARDSVHYKKQKSKAFLEQDNYEITKISEDSFQIKNKNATVAGNGLLAFGNNVKIVTFNFYEKEVHCTCEAWKTEKVYKLKADEVCKHVPLIILKCDQAELYYGNRSLTDKDIDRLSTILQTFNPMRRIEDQNHINEPPKKDPKKAKRDGDKFLTKKMLLNLDNDGPFSSRESAIASSPQNSWYGELYAVGGNPGCRSCSKKINVKGTQEKDKVVIRTDVAYSFLPPFPNSQHILKVETIRFCLNNFCHKNIQRKAYCNFKEMETISLKFLPNEFHQLFEEVFLNTPITITY